MENGSAIPRKPPGWIVRMVTSHPRFSDLLPEPALVELTEFLFDLCRQRGDFESPVAVLQWDDYRWQDGSWSHRPA